MNPLKFEPIFHERLWGSDRLARVFGKSLPAGVRIGESWELADLPEDCSRIAEGPLTGRTLRQVLETNGSELGFRARECDFPFGLLIKFLDADDHLSVQVHPDEDACQALESGRLKTECWYVLAAEPGAVIYRGLKPAVSRVDMQKALGAGEVEKLLQVHAARAGDFHYLPAGTVHAIGAGILIAEIQTPSDTTYRLFDWNRLDSSGKSRELHIDEALISTHFGDDSSLGKGANRPAEFESPITECRGFRDHIASLAKGLGAAEVLVNGPYFGVAHLTLPAGEAKPVVVTRPSVMVMLAGAGRITDADGNGEGTAFRAGDTLLIGVTGQARFEMSEAGACLVACLGPESVGAG